MKRRTFFAAPLALAFPVEKAISAFTPVAEYNWEDKLIPLPLEDLGEFAQYYNGKQFPSRLHRVLGGEHLIGEKIFHFETSGGGGGILANGQTVKNFDDYLAENHGVKLKCMEDFLGILAPDFEPHAAHYYGA